LRIVHTSDWHAGRVWKGVNRLPELADVLENLGEFLERERIDLLLMSGDVFDSGAPNPAAEKLVFGFFKRIGQAGVKSIVIAGNHDSPARLQAWGTLAELVDVRAVAFPRKLDEGGLVEVEVRSGETARVAAVPFARPRHLVTALELAGDETEVKQKYDHSMRQIISHLVSGFEADSVNLLMAHTHLHGAVLSGSERQVHLGDEWATTPQALPSAAHYVALGHIHKPQKVEAAPAPTRYAGSPLQLDFGEAGEEKSFLMIDARPRQPARIEPVSYQGGMPLRTIRKRLAELEKEAGKLSGKGWLRVKVPLDAADPDINGRVRRLLPNVVAVEVELPERREDKVSARPPHGAPPRELYRAYFQEERGSEPGDALMDAFDKLLREEHEEH
jgi:exonuclease SbcD